MGLFDIGSQDNGATDMSGLEAMYSTTFGNPNFYIQAPEQRKGEVGEGFPTIPYMPIEAILWQQQTSNPVVGTENVATGSFSGQQNLSGYQSMADATNTSRYLAGFQNG